MESYDIILRTLRTQAWARAKGELNATLAAFVGLRGAEPGQFEKLQELIVEFMEDVEDLGLVE